MIYIKDHEFEALGGMNIELSTNQFKPGLYIITGESGVGKSSFFEGLYNGKISVEINNVQYDVTQRNFQIRYAPQNQILLDHLTVSENINLCGENLNKIEPILKKLDCLYLIEQNKMFGLLSAEEKQKLKIGIVLNRTCPVLLLDEIDSNLSDESINRLALLLRERAKNSVVFLITSKSELYIKYAEGHLQFKHQQVEYRHIYEKKRFEQEIKQVIDSKSRELRELKLISKYFNKSLLIFLVVSIIFSYAFNQTITELNRLNYTMEPYTKKYTDNSTIILPPINNPYYSIVGNQSWLSKTPLLLDKEFYQTIEKLDYVSKIESISKVSTVSNYVTYLNDGKQFKLKTDQITIDIDNLHPEIKALAKEYNITLGTDYKLEIGQLELPSKVLNKTPYTVGYDLLYGSYPEDDTNQVIIPLELAESLIKTSKLNSIDDLIGKRYNVALEEVSGEQIVGNEKQDFVVSGIYNHLTNAETIIIYAYSDDSIVSKSNNCGLVNDFELEICARNIASNAYDDNEYSELAKNNQLGAYSGIYVEVKSEQDLAKLTNFVRNYDKHIFVDNDYTRSEEVINSSTRFKLIEVGKKIILIVGSYLMVLWVLYCSQRKQLEHVHKLLGHTNFPPDLIKQYSLKKLKIIPLISSVCLVLPYFINLYIIHYDFIEYGYYNKIFFWLITIIYILMIGLLYIYNKFLIRCLMKSSAT